MGNLVLKGHISSATKRKYKWIAEFGKNTCEKCAALNGREFDEDKVPYWPHPNCRCKVEEISVVDEIESELNEYREEIEQLKLQANELLGDANVLREQLELIQRDSNNVAEPLDSQLTRIEYKIYQLIDKINSLTIDEITTRVLNEIQKKMEDIQNKISEYCQELKNLNTKIKLEKIVTDLIVQAGSPLAKDASSLWVLASSKFNRGLDYIEKNGEIINKISDLKNEALQKTVTNKLKSQNIKKESRGLRLYTNSSLAKSISNSQKFKDIINEQIIKEKLINGETINKISTSLTLNINNYLAVHGCDILNVRIENGTLYAMVLDTVDYNPNDIKVKLPRDLQEANAIENYYILIDIAEPISKYFKK